MRGGATEGEGEGDGVAVGEAEGEGDGVGIEQLLRHDLGECPEQARHAVEPPGPRHLAPVPIRGDRARAVGTPPCVALPLAGLTPETVAG